MKIDVKRARAELEKIRHEIREHEDILNGCREVERQLVTFLAMAEQYRIEEDVPAAIAAIEERALAGDHFHPPAPITPQPPTDPAEPPPPPPPSTETQPAVETAEIARDMTLKRRPDTRQTQIALALTRDFRPGDILTAKDCAAKWGDRFVHPEGTVQPGHYISSFLIKEAMAQNGLLQRVGVGQYRLKENPQVFLGSELPQ